MNDYETAPAYRDRKFRKRNSLLYRAGQAFLVLVLAMLTAFAFLSLFILFLMMIPGCTTMSLSEQQELQAAARGCYCAGRECKEIESAAGQAAVQAAAEQSGRVTKIEAR